MGVAVTLGRSAPWGKVAPRDHTRATKLLSRVLRMMRLAGGVKASLIGETLAYQLVWPH